MSSDELWAAKLRFLEKVERDLRRKLSKAEQVLLTRVFEQVIQKMATDKGLIKPTAQNFTLLNELSRVYEQFRKEFIVKAVAELATSMLTGAEMSIQYFSAEVPGANVATIGETAKRVIRERMGITTKGQLVPGGYLHSLIEDVTVRNELHKRMVQIIDRGTSDIDGMRREVRAYLMPPATTTVAEPAGPVERQFARYTFDTLQRSDRSTNLVIANELGLPAATWTGGLIDTSRCLCQKLNGKTWTREEYEEIDKGEWDGKNGSIFVDAGGFECRHIQRWVGMGATLRKRPDLELVEGQLTQRVGVTPQPFNECVDHRRKRA